jgi:hypothetical protein
MEIGAMMPADIIVKYSKNYVQQHKSDQSHTKQGRQQPHASMLTSFNCAAVSGAAPAGMATV